MISSDVLVIGAGAAGLMAAATAGQRGKSVVVVDHANTIGEKIRISGGGRCNFTNLHTAPIHFISNNPHFCKSALARFTPRDFLKQVEGHGIRYHEKAKGQLFCDNSAQQIIDLLLTNCADANVTLKTGTTIHTLTKTETGFELETSKGRFTASAVIVATGGLSIPKIGATGFGHDIARRFGLKIVDPRPALVPLTFDKDILDLANALSGVSVNPATVSTGKAKFEDAILFTHRGLSGPAILQISSYWVPGTPIVLNLAPHVNVLDFLKSARKDHPKKMLHTMLETLLPGRLAEAIAQRTHLDGQMANLADAKLSSIAKQIAEWEITPSGTEGYRTAEVTAGGVDTDELSSKTFESKKVPGLYFIGEVIDVTGWLGGFNFQWAWSSGYCAGQSV